MMSRYLITTADERTWKFDRPVLFLGEWCRRYDKRHVWEGMDAEVASPYGLESSQKKRDIYFVQTLANQLLDELAESLNQYHKTKHSVRYWHVLIGHWVHRYVGILFNRYTVIENVVKKYQLSGSTAFDPTGFHLFTNNSCDLINICNDNVWNNIIWSKMLGELSGCEVEHIPHGDSSDKNIYHAAVGTLKKKMGLMQSAKGLFQEILPLFCKKRDAFIINSYLPRGKELLLQMMMGQIPQFWTSPKYKPVSPDFSARSMFFPDGTGFDGFGRIVRRYVRELIPICYLEGYESLLEQVKSLRWPKHPKFIFTSNNYNTDEVFKAWTGEKIENEKVPYFIGQHGNLYGTEIGSENYPEEVVGDRFITWGWSNGNPKMLPAFVFKTINRKPRQAVVDGGILLIEVHPPHMLTVWDSYNEYIQYQEEQFRFVESLPSVLQPKLTVRFHPEYDKHEWSVRRRWLDRSPQTMLEFGSERIQNLVNTNKVIVHSYDSTGILETLNLNIPTLSFWRGGLDHLLPRAKVLYQRLQDVGIIASTPEQAAAHVSKYWDNMDEWWLSGEVQSARIAFCQEFARRESKPLRFLKRQLLDHSSQINEAS